MKKRNTFVMIVGGAAFVGAAYALVMRNQMVDDAQNTEPVHAMDTLPAPTDAQIDTLLMRLRIHNETPDVDDEKLLNSLKSYKQVLKSRQQKTK